MVRTLLSKHGARSSAEPQPSDFDPAEHLEMLTGEKLDHSRLNIRAHRQRLAQIDRQPLMPGVKNYLDAGEQLELGLAVASSSPHDWVDGYLKHRELFHYFDSIKAREDVRATKPEPDLFLSALSALGVQPDQAVVFEDSPNGVKAAKRAGVFVVAVPNPLTVQLAFEGEDLRLSSLAEIPLPELLRRAELETK